MCGIAGFVNHKEKALLEKSLKNIAHRGPDGEGIWISPDGQVALGHRRLSIIDRSDAASQPMHYLDRFCIIFNGEIYNFIELRKELTDLGYKFRTESDTEVVLASYCEWKEKCLLKFNGMWAFAIWDKSEKRLFIARDRFGVKPLYYTIDHGKLAFGSEMKALFPYLKNVEPSDDFKWCSENMFRYEATEKCLIKDIQRFPAGYYGYYIPEENEIRKTRYWNTAENLVKVSERYDEQVEQFRALFIDAVKLRMRSDVCIGTTLSGGLDSSAVISTMANINTNGERIAKDWQHAFVACFKGTFLDERVYAEKVVDHLGVPATFIEIEPPEFDELYKMFYQFEDLYITSPVPMMGIYKELRKNNVVVSVDGHGADELLSGYGDDLKYALLDAGFNIAAIKNIQSAYASRLPDDVQFDTEKSGIINYFRDLKALSGGKKPFLKYVVSGGKVFKQRKDDFGAFNAVLYDIFHNTVLPTLLRNYDRYSMASGVEVRMPFMDYRLVTFMFSLPWTSKIRNGFTKAILRDAIGPFMPDSITWRKTKIGFHTPLIDWIRNDWKKNFDDILCDDKFQKSAFIPDPDLIKNIYEQIVYDPKVSFQKGELFWEKISPFLWEQSFLKMKAG